jgi:phosphate transport system permease protein
MGNAIVGTLLLLAIASALGIPIGVGAGMYLAENKGHGSTAVRFLSDVLNGLPRSSWGSLPGSLSSGRWDSSRRSRAGSR